MTTEGSRKDAGRAANTPPWSVVPRTMGCMPYDQTLADRIGDLVTGEEGLTQQRMFGGLAFLVNGNMAVAADREGSLCASTPTMSKRG